LLQTHYPHIRYTVVQEGPPLPGPGNFCICCIDHPEGEAYKMAAMSKSKGMTVINLGALLKNRKAILGQIARCIRKDTAGIINPK